MMEQGGSTIEQMEAWVRDAVDRHGDDGDRFAFSGILEDRDRLRSQLASLIDLIRRRYPRLLERGNPMYDGLLADAVRMAEEGGTLNQANQEIDRLRAELQRGRGWVPEKPRPVLDINGEPMRGVSLQMWHRGWDDLASRLPSIKEGEVVVDREEWEAVLDFAERIVPIRDNLSGISWVGSLRDVFAAYDNWYALRSAQAKGGT